MMFDMADAVVATRASSCGTRRGPFVRPDLLGAAVHHEGCWVEMAAMDRPKTAAERCGIARRLRTWR